MAGGPTQSAPLHAVAHRGASSTMALLARGGRRPEWRLMSLLYLMPTAT